MAYRYLKDIVTLEYDEEKCTGCGACAVNCPFSAISVRSGVGCAWAILLSQIKKKDQPSCCG